MTSFLGFQFLSPSDSPGQKVLVHLEGLQVELVPMQVLLPGAKLPVQVQRLRVVPELLVEQQLVRWEVA